MAWPGPCHSFGSAGEIPAEPRNERDPAPFFRESILAGRKMIRPTAVLDFKCCTREGQAGALMPAAQ